MRRIGIRMEFVVDVDDDEEYADAVTRMFAESDLEGRDFEILWEEDD